MNTSKTGIDLIKKYEGCRLQAYKCASGVLTIGYGHTGKDVKEGMIITKEKANSLLKKDVEKFEKHVSQYNKIYNWNQNQFDALVSFAFNIGNINQLTAKGTRTIKQISEAMLLYNKANGKVLRGLDNRRLEEQRLFNSGNNTTYYRVNAVSGLICRKSPSSTGEVVGAFKFNTIIEVLNKSNSPWWKVIGIDINGKKISGFCHKKYIKTIAP